MTRIIAGELGGRRIAVPPKGTRPTTDRVREAIFSRLDHEDRLRGAVVLDLFAGSGALGLEALSRGAARATFVEADARAVAVVRENARALGVADRTTVVRGKAASFLASCAETFDLVLLDPPYGLPPEDLASTLAAIVARTPPGAAVVLEGSSRAAAPRWPSGLEAAAEKTYGETTVHYAVAVATDSLEA